MRAGRRRRRSPPPPGLSAYLETTQFGGAMADSENGVDDKGPACINCRRRKRKCSRGSPCQRCADLSVPCIYEENSIKSSAGHDLDRRMDQLENRIINRLERLEAEVFDDGYGRKRRRVTPESSRDDFLPPPDILKQAVEVYFDQVHPWIPILHMPTFRAAISFAPSIVLHAIVAVTVKFLDLDLDEQAYYYSECRKLVLLSCMDRFSIESLQASIILAFETIGCGTGPRSWSIVSSITRIADQLGLGCEEEDVEDKPFNRISFLPPSTSSAEQEGRRRIFWAGFLMDRFCSVATGWNTSMSSSDIRRRLPMEGANYAQNDNRKSRYFNISETEIGSANDDDAMGGYSYLIEATECLSRVVTFLLHETHTVVNVDDLKVWINKVLKLNSMLVEWKASLPQKWKSLRPTERGLDENLALAHVTHDTSVLLLHHNLAYPPPELVLLGKWKQSEQICLSTAIEIATITNQFLSRVSIVVSPQFSFCAFIAGRTLLTNQLQGNTSRQVDSNFALIVGCLREMAHRWMAKGKEKNNLAAKFADRLEAAKNSQTLSVGVFFEDEDSYSGNLSLSSPPVADMISTQPSTTTTMGKTGSMAPVTEDLTDELGNIKDLFNINELDYIFSWNYDFE
uniref:ARAD1A13310p n=1 Tax=Blastobotrys adeninivorans TaxID=409370 RepID=A0A060SY22_BLAAD